MTLERLGLPPDLGKRDHMHMTTSTRRPRVLLMLLACLGLALPLLVSQSASAASPAVATIKIDRIWSDVTDPKGTPTGSLAAVLVQANETFHIDVSFYDADHNPASFNTDTTLAIASSTGTLKPSTGVVPKGWKTWTLNTSLTAAANRVVLTVSVAGAKGPRAVTSDPSSDQPFDVVSQLRTATSTDNFKDGFVGGIGGDTDCTTATKDAPVCGIVMLPKGAASSVLLSTGVCDGTKDYTPCTPPICTTTSCSPGGAVIQTLFADGGLYTPTAPATLLMKCDKTRCGTGSIQKVPVYYSLGINTALQKVPPCPAKNTVGTDPTTGLLQDMCVDYVQSQRDGSGDTYLYILFTKDARVGMG